MEDSNRLQFHETQYLGYNRFGILRRVVIALFCFVFYFFTEQKGQEESMGELFFYLGIIVLMLSAISMMLKYLEIKVEGETLYLNGPWSYRRVQIPISDIASIAAGSYSRFYLNRPVFNLHRKGKVRFYAHGQKAVRLLTRDGQSFVVGTQKPELLKEVIDRLRSGDN